MPGTLLRDVYIVCYLILTYPDEVSAIVPILKMRKGEAQRSDIICSKSQSQVEIGSS